MQFGDGDNLMIGKLRKDKLKHVARFIERERVARVVAIGTANADERRLPTLAQCPQNHGVTKMDRFPSRDHADA